MKKRVDVRGGNRAYYDAGSDHVRIPVRGAFPNAESFMERWPMRSVIGQAIRRGSTANSGGSVMKLMREKN